jgi:hypothetical protein
MNGEALIRRLARIFLTACSPSPRPSPLGRGRIVARRLARRVGLERSRRGRGCSLSLRERVRVRGNKPRPDHAPPHMAT